MKWVMVAKNRTHEYTADSDGPLVWSLFMFARICWAGRAWPRSLRRMP